jgi:hypothetical protein
MKKVAENSERRDFLRITGVKYPMSSVSFT